MKKICFIVPYFGKLPVYFQVWLDSCAANDTINWLVFTNDKTEYKYPTNVEPKYMIFDELKTLIQSNFDFTIALRDAYKLCDYKVAYGEIFHDYLKGYDFWGFCDVDLIWGRIRDFYTDEVLSKFFKIGCRGHAMIFRNTHENNSVYKTKVDMHQKEDGTQCENYDVAFSTDNICCTDRELVKFAFSDSGIDSYDETIYAGLQKYEPGFYLQGLTEAESAEQKRQLFLWEDGRLTRYYLSNCQLKQKDYLYIHFFARPMKNEIKKMDRVLIYPDCYMNFYDDVTIDVVSKYGKKSRAAYYWRVFKQNRNRLSIKKVVEYFKIKMTYNKHA